MTDPTTPDAAPDPSPAATPDVTLPLGNSPVHVANAVVATIPLSSTLKTYAAALLPFFVLAIGGLGEVLKAPSAASIIPFLVLVFGAGLTYVVPLLPSGWQGFFKTGIPILTTILSAVLTYVLAGTLTWGNSTIVIVGVLTAVATEFGVQIRTSKSDVALAA